MLNSNRKIANLRNLHPLICSTKSLNKKYGSTKNDRMKKNRTKINRR